MLKHVLVSLLLLPLVPSTLQAADGSFVGKWKLNPEKTTLHDQMKVTAAGPNRYAFDFGGGSEFIVVNGTDQPGLQGSTLAVTEKGPRSWQVVRKMKGRMEISAIWTLLPDGTLRDDFTGYPSDGSSFTIHYIYSSIAGTAAGFAGTWDSTTEKASPGELEVQPYEGDGLSFTNLAQHTTKLMKFDGKDYPVKDPKAAPGAMSSARRVNARTLAFSEKREGKVVDTQHIQLSADNRILTITVQPSNRLKPNVFVYERE